MSQHIGRSFSDNRLEVLCPCPLEPCGLVDTDKSVEECPQHPFGRAQTIRQMHDAEECPGPRAGHSTVKAVVS